ncbi:putative dimeric dihydrodiol dehydrogenase [Aspergillus sclerotioniger CBS 115572]|uniref:D-xylose 1-dehydrogenase (NADP(+), D-xylono-1,5-lactone-forming) n=1 Tax=Aspergillus sclerotioniger CBS 115572 TaxID=1450535 RepID=A0A317XBC2_9EURO|nr:putative dimeric dihydrodiol dehydrogenase [Aspergillus sclerotioniger CBS 115572]PWY95411.1 putative dimeric dihydrodiol dehydrogenase [Aspergillus sclerotioniger CBS 115572]
MEPKTIRWGILATGEIAQTFTKDLLVDPSTRNVTTIKHTVVAAASSSGSARAQSFLTTPPTPHSHHYRNVKLCLESGKNVLCEKAFTVNAAQAAELVRIARDKDLFLMEALWTRYFPLSVYVRQAITQGRLGTIMRAFADSSLDLSPEQSFGPDHRMVSPALAGGALLDMGIYSLTWIFQTLYTTQSSEERERAPPPTVVSSVQKYSLTGVDETVSMLLTFPRDTEFGGDMHGVATTGFCVPNDGTKGELQVWPPIYWSTRTRLAAADGTVEDKTWTQPGPGRGSNWFNGYSIAGRNPEGEGYGMFWEADEAGLALVEGRKEGRSFGLDESVLIMEIMDKVREQNGLVYPEEIEATDRTT